MRTFKDYIGICARGIAMGAADVVPGVSGGTIAFISGIYEEFINSLKSLNLKNLKILFTQGIAPFWKAINGSFLLSLFLGIAISILSLSKVIKFLLADYPILVWSFFFGLIIASILLIGKQITKWNLLAILMLLSGVGISYYITIIEPTSNVGTYTYIAISGFFAIIAMLLPGISGAFILLLMGSYSVIMETLNQLTSFNKDLMLDAFTKIAIFGGGAILGVLSFSRILSYMFSHYKNVTLALLTGFMIGSLNKVWPWKETISTRINSHRIEVPFIQKNIGVFAIENNYLVGAIICAILGFLVIFLLEKVGSKKS